MNDKQPEALRLADALEQYKYSLSFERDATAAELRRLHDESERLSTLCYDLIGKLTAMRAEKHMRKHIDALRGESMNDKQPEALRLTDALEQSLQQTDADDYVILVDRWLVEELAVELRRLHEAHDWQHKMAGDRLRRIEKLQRINNELLEALKEYVAMPEFDGTSATSFVRTEAKRKAKEAIAKSGGEEVSKHTSRHDRKLLESLRMNMNLPPYNASLNPCAHDGIMWVHLVHQYGERAVKAAAEYLQKTEGRS